jgi:hypothetical protein
MLSGLLTVTFGAAAGGAVFGAQELTAAARMANEQFNRDFMVGP